jgi:hypothetical protein
MLIREIVAVHVESNRKHINTLCAQNAAPFYAMKNALTGKREMLIRKEPRHLYSLP